MKRAVAGLVAAACACGANTTVAERVVGPDGQPASGYALIRISAPCTSGGVWVGRQRRVPFNGNFTVSLAPNDSCLIGGQAGGTSYQVVWQADGDKPRTENWVVPTSGSAVTIDQVRQPVFPLPIAALADGTYTIAVSGYQVTSVAVTAPQVDLFTTAASSYTLSATPAAGTEQIFVNGLLMAPGVDYTITGQALDFSGQDTAGMVSPVIQAVYWTTASQMAGMKVDVFQNASQTYTLSATPAGSGAVWVNGLRMAVGVDYTLIGTALTFAAGQDTAGMVSPVVQVRYWAN